MNSAPAGNIFEAAARAQNVARDMGRLQMGAEVMAWAAKHAFSIPAPALRELAEIAAPEREKC